MRRAERGAGGRPRTSALSGVGSLTPSERRVTALAADGYTNREVAEALFVTPKTVEMHLGNAYRKLGARSRRDLPGLLQNAGGAADMPQSRSDASVHTTENRGL
jgi:DNA-binding CsgD family transcriptional regulator